MIRHHPANKATFAQPIDLNSPISSPKKFPDFLVIGGMKCATTTLHQDLSQHPDVFCGQKELNALTNSKLGTPAEQYRRNFRAATTNQLRGDVSTTYSMLPKFPEVAELAMTLLGHDIKIIYVVREPIARTLSHHQHLMNDRSAEKMGPDINAEIHTRPELIDYSRYAFQLQPWIQKFGFDQIKVVRFEDFVVDRHSMVKQLFEFLQLPPVEIQLDADGANRGHDRLAAGSFISSLYRSKMYQQFIRPLASDRVRNLFRQHLLKRTKVRSIPPTKTTIDLIYDQVIGDVRELQKITGSSKPFWDLDEQRTRFHQQLKSQNQQAVR